jgi:predicted RNA-binding protein with TRAM domain
VSGPKPAPAGAFHEVIITPIGRRHAGRQRADLQRAPAFGFVVPLVEAVRLPL